MQVEVENIIGVDCRPARILADATVWFVLSVLVCFWWA